MFLLLLKIEWMLSEWKGFVGEVVQDAVKLLVDKSRGMEDVGKDWGEVGLKRAWESSAGVGNGSPWLGRLGHQGQREKKKLRECGKLYVGGRASSVRCDRGWGRCGGRREEGGRDERKYSGEMARKRG